MCSSRAVAPAQADNGRRYSQAVYQGTWREGELWREQRGRRELTSCEQTTNLIINFEHDDWILDDESATLASQGIGECSCMVREELELMQDCRERGRDQLLQSRAVRRLQAQPDAELVRTGGVEGGEKFGTPGFGACCVNYWVTRRPREDTSYFGSDDSLRFFCSCAGASSSSPFLFSTLSACSFKSFFALRPAFANSASRCTLSLGIVENSSPV